MNSPKIHHITIFHFELRGSKYFEMFLWFILSLLASLVGGQEETLKCQVTLKDGTITGLLTNTLNPDKKVCAFTSIPYASPPIESLRFKPPEPAKKWGPEVLNATGQPNWCPQKGSPPQGVQISEDCLYLNVFQPVKVANSSGSDGLPVFIWFHGGSFTSGSSSMYNPVKMQSRNEDVIVVIVQYRLGLLGFLSTGDLVVPGNNGLKDQSFSIRWVHDNIKAFGGNPDKITIFGESAGGASVMFQLISPLNKGLLAGAISQSGTALSSWALDKNPKDSAELMSRLLLCPTIFGTSAMVSCLRKVSWKRIIDVQGLYSLLAFSKFNYPYATITPVVEPKLPGAFISDEPEEIMRKGDIPDIPVVIGANKHDGSFVFGALYAGIFGPRKLDQDSEYVKNKLVPDLIKIFGAKEDYPGARGLASSLELTYLDGVTNRSSWDESMPGLVDMMTVLSYKSPVQNSAEILSRRNRTVYVYSFEHHSENTLWPLYFGENAKSIRVKPGITHGDELMYLFTLPPSTGKFSTEDLTFTEIFTDLWLNFGKTGNPTPSEQEDKRFDVWVPYNINEETYYKINGTPATQAGYRNSWRPNGFQWD